MRWAGDRHGQRVARLACAAVITGVLAAALAPQANAAPAGSLDRSFAGDGRKLTDFFGARDRAEAVAFQGKGKIVVAGSANRKRPGFRGCEMPALARYKRDGSLDRSFGKRGKAIVHKLGGPCDNEANALAIQENGKIVVAGISSINLAMMRFRRNGKLDRSFGKRGKVVIDIDPGWNRVADVAIQADGKIVVVGHTHGVTSGDYFLMARYLRDGTLDEGFGDEGVVVTRFGQDTYVLGYGVAIQDDQRIVVSGEVGNSWILARFLADGSLDASFGNDEGVAHSGPIAVARAYDVALQDDGRIVATGVDPASVSGAQFALARNLPGGSPDPSFAEGGGAHIGFGPRPSEFGKALALQNDGKIVATGDATRGSRRIVLARLRPNGALDRSFSKDGKVKTGFPQRPRTKHDDYAEAVAVQPNGRIVVVGSSRPKRGDDNFAIARYLGKRSG